MKNSDYPAKPVREWVITVVIMRERHKVWVRAQIERVLCMAEVICRVIDADDLVPVDLIVDKNESSVFIISEGTLITIVWLVEQPTQADVF